MRLRIVRHITFGIRSVSFWYPFGILPVSFWYPFGILSVSFRYPNSVPNANIFYTLCHSIICPYQRFRGRTWHEGMAKAVRHIRRRSSCPQTPVKVLRPAVWYGLHQESRILQILAILTDISRMEFLQLQVLKYL